MHATEEITRLLNSGEWLSNKDIALKTVASAQEAEQIIDGLIDNGLPLEHDEHGVRLPDDFHLLDAEEVADYLLPTTPLDSFEVLQTVESTNSYLLSQQINVGRVRVCLSESQSSGRGRRGNTWQSSPYRNIMMSLSWGFERWPETIGALSLAVGLCLAEELRTDYGIDAEIKWPNDVLISGAKLAGILIDVAGDAAGECKVVIGIGLNVAQPDWSNGQDNNYHWQDLAGLGVQVNRNVLIGSLLNRLVDMLKRFELAGFAPLMERWNALNCFDNMMVRVGDEQNTVVGQMQGVDPGGALILGLDDGSEYRITDSNLSLRLVDGSEMGGNVR